jgi:hypothetical protein
MFATNRPALAAWTYITGGLLALFAVLISGCGGGASLSAPAAQNNQPQGGADARLLPLGSPLPALPLDLTGAPAHSASAILDYPGAVFLNAAGGTVDGTDLVLQSSADQPAWAMYKADGLTGLKVVGFSVETVPGDLDTQYSVGLSNFSDGQWQYFLTTSLPEAQIDLSDNTKRLTSRLGNLYYIVVVSGGQSLRMKAGHVFTADSQDGWTPGMGNGLFVSKGLPDKIHIEWGVMDGATGYELWRMQDSGNHGASSEAGDGFSLVATTDGTSYDDTAVQPSTVYIYKVRGVNAAGAGGFSGTERGYMGAPPAGGGGDDSGLDAHGLIALLSNDRLTLDGGYSFKLTGDTEWFLADGSIGSPSDFAVGDTVDVHGVNGADGALIALLVKLQQPPAGDPSEVDAHGVITNLSNDRSTLDNGFSFFLNGDTQWFLADGSPAGAGDFAVGDTVDVHGRKTDGGVLTALTVRMDAADGGGGGAGDHFREEGTIQVREAGVLSFDNGETFSYNGDTKWYGADGNPADLLQFFTGVKVAVEGLMDGSVRNATAVRILPGGEGQFQEYDGTIANRDGGKLNMSDAMSFSWGVKTLWFLADGSPSTSDAFGPGDSIHVVYEVNGGSKLAVKVIMVHDISI